MTDGGDDPLSDSMTCSLIITDENDEYPVFDYSAFPGQTVIVNLVRNKLLIKLYKLKFNHLFNLQLHKASLINRRAQNQIHYPTCRYVIDKKGPAASFGYLEPRQLKDPGMDPSPQLGV